jgi:hypothetical protein
VEVPDLYHTLVTCSWWTFYGLLAGGYLAVNLLFALGYIACGPDAPAGASTSRDDRFFDAFFFSVLGSGGKPTIDMSVLSAVTPV